MHSAAKPVWRLLSIEKRSSPDRVVTVIDPARLFSSHVRANRLDTKMNVSAKNANPGQKRYRLTRSDSSLSAYRFAGNRRTGWHCSRKWIRVSAFRVVRVLRGLLAHFLYGLFRLPTPSGEEPGNKVPWPIDLANPVEPETTDSHSK